MANNKKMQPKKSASEIKEENKGKVLNVALIASRVLIIVCGLAFASGLIYGAVKLLETFKIMVG